MFLAACSSTPSKQDMYKYNSKATTATPASQGQAERAAKQREQVIAKLNLSQMPRPSELVSKRAFDIQTALGQPSFVRKDQGVQVWQYRRDDCILDLFLYQNDNGFQVHHSELRGPYLNSAGELACFQKILARTY